MGVKVSVSGLFHNNCPIITIISVACHRVHKFFYPKLWFCINIINQYGIMPSSKNEYSKPKEKMEIEDT